MAKELSFKQNKFLEEYLADPKRDGAAAARRAGYSIKTAPQIAYRLLKHPLIAPVIKEDRQKLAKTFGITQEMICQELYKLGMANIQDFAGVTEDGESIRTIPREMAAAISEWTVETVDGRVSTTKKKVKLSDKRAALIDLAKMLGYYNDKVEVNGTFSLQQLVEASMIEEEPIEVESKEIKLLEAQNGS